MLKTVRITEKASGTLIARYPVIFEITDATEEDYLEEAWQNAIDGGLVDKDKRSHYDVDFVVDILAV